MLNALRMDDLPLMPDSIFQAFTSLQVLNELDNLNQEDDCDIPPFPFDLLGFCYKQLQQLYDVLTSQTILLYDIFRVIFPHGRNGYVEVFPRLAVNPTTFWLMTENLENRFFKVLNLP